MKLRFSPIGKQGIKIIRDRKGVGLFDPIFGMHSLSDFYEMLPEIGTKKSIVYDAQGKAKVRNLLQEMVKDVVIENAGGRGLGARWILCRQEREGSF